MTRDRRSPEATAAPRRVTVVGCGHVGLVLAAGLARLGHHVVGLDRDPSLVLALSRGMPHFFEEDLEALLAEGLADERLSFTSSYEAALRDAEFVFLAVDTPPTENGAPDLTNLRAAAAAIGGALHGSHPLVIVKSTVPVGTCSLVQDILASSNGHTPERTRVLSNPEFLRQGKAVHDFFHPDRTVVGASADRDAQLVGGLFASLPGELVLTDVATSEMIKYGSNAFLAVRVSFINEIAAVCDALGIDIDGVVEGMGHDPRIGHAFNRPGIGFGGSCLPKDVAAVRHVAAVHGINTPLLSAVQGVNAAQPARAVRRLRAELGGLDRKTVAVWGVTFKGGTDDVRQSPAMDVVALLLAEGARLHIYDPSGAGGLPDHLRGAVRADALEAARDADALAVLSDWPHFRTVDFALVRDAMCGDVILDGRNVLDPKVVAEAGLRYMGMGRGSASASSLRPLATRSPGADHPARTDAHEPIHPLAERDAGQSEAVSVPLRWELARVR